MRIEPDGQRIDRREPAWILPHRHDPYIHNEPCIYCKTPRAKVVNDSCPVTLAELWSRIGDVSDLSIAARERAIHAGEATESGKVYLDEVRRLDDLALRMKQLHRVLKNDLRRSEVIDETS